MFEEGDRDKNEEQTQYDFNTGLPQRPAILYSEKVAGGKNQGAQPKGARSLPVVPPTSYINQFKLGQVVIHKRFNQPKPFEGQSAAQIAAKINEALVFAKATIDNEPIMVRAVSQFSNRDVKIFTKDHIERAVLCYNSLHLKGQHYLQGHLQCYNCQAVGHLAHSCKEKPVFSRCGKDHNSASCGEMEDTTLSCQRCLNIVQKHSTEINLADPKYDHSPFSNACSACAKELASLSKDKVTNNQQP
ncbi:hypothetical protein VP01_1524g3 [Puccinia sorghi]|uniref:CCHC-type domain-containing protein n=1 Tax=Puccinia sorghi TaxID=27349 RepID=A0A0L6VIN7_9BASI|nr:hypothetical protein VP01_1524g3 [Puccinia sorghi]